MVCSNMASLSNSLACCVSQALHHCLRILPVILEPPCFICLNSHHACIEYLYAALTIWASKDSRALRQFWKPSAHVSSFSSPGVGLGSALEAVTVNSPSDSEVLLLPDSVMVSFSTSVTAGVVTGSSKRGGRVVGPSDSDIAAPSDSRSCCREAGPVCCIRPRGYFLGSLSKILLFRMRKRFILQPINQTIAIAKHHS